MRRRVPRPVRGGVARHAAAHDHRPKKCDGTYAAWDVDYGSDSCPADDTGPNPCANLRVHRVFWRGVDGAWVLLGHQGSGDCAEARTYDPTFPEAICTP